ncbi:MAG: FHA domain-containing protein [Bryobacterales bacterium]|nr:FHA domain-containing protein [Bryobacterales bacterium]
MAEQHLPVTPEEIIDTILDELEAETAPSRYSVFVRSVFHIFLHPADFAALRPAFAMVEQEARRALNERLAQLNKRSVLDVFAAAANQVRKNYRRIGSGDWKIYFYENHDAEAEENPLIVKSLFDEPKAVEERIGAATERTVRRSAGGGKQTTSNAAGAAETQRTEPPVYATLEYEDDLGPQQFDMAKPFIRVGRKLKDEAARNTVWVDCIVTVNANVSKEHCEIRFDSGQRTFFLKDTSKYGTSVNGALVPKDGEVRLPGKAKIRLADAVTLHFHSQLA